MSVRLDTHGGRFLQGLDTPLSYAVLERNVPEAIRGYRSEAELRHLMGTGVSAAAIWHMREELNKEGFDQVKIVASSGFSLTNAVFFASEDACRYDRNRFLFT